MKRNLIHLRAVLGSLMLALVLLIGVSPAASAAGPLFRSRSYPDFQLQNAALPEVTVDAILNANAYETLLDKYDGFAVETFTNAAYSAGDSYSFFYGTPYYDFYSTSTEAGEQPAEATLMTESNLYRVSLNEENEIQFGINWSAVPGGEETHYLLKDEAMALDEAALLNYEIASVEDNGDGLLRVVLTETVAEESEVVDDWGTGTDIVSDESNEWYNIPAEEDTVSYGADSWYENAASWYDEHLGAGAAAQNETDGVIIALVLDAATLEIQKAEQTMILDDGTEELLAVQVMSYTVPNSILFNELVVRAGRYEMGSMTENLRTVTVIYDPGTEYETVCTRTVGKGDFLYTGFLAGYQLCEDLDGTPFVGSDGQSDVTIYAFPEDTVWEPAETPSTSESEQSEDMYESIPVPVIVEPLPETAESEPEVLPVPIIIEDSMYDSEETHAADSDNEVAEEAEPENSVIEEVPEFHYANEAIFEANRLDRILQNHSAVEYQLVFDDDNTLGRPDYVYETSEMAYAESPATAVYVGGGNFYEMTENDAGSELYYVFDFCNDYDPAANAGYEIVPETYEEWWNEEEETAIACYLENGELHLVSVSNEEKSRDFVENYLGGVYDGETVITEAVADPETYELLRFVYNLQKEGEITEPLTYLVAYDRPEPRACRNLRAIAERDTAQNVTVTLVRNPGADDEVSQTKTVPVGSNVVYIAEERMEMFEDSECTIPAGQWDKISDHTYYMIPAEKFAGEM